MKSLTILDKNFDDAEAGCHDYLLLNTYSSIPRPHRIYSKRPRTWLRRWGSCKSITRWVLLLFLILLLCGYSRYILHGRLVPPSHNNEPLDRDKHVDTTVMRETSKSPLKEGKFRRPGKNIPIESKLVQWQESKVSKRVSVQLDESKDLPPPPTRPSAANQDQSQMLNMVKKANHPPLDEIKRGPTNEISLKSSATGEMDENQLLPVSEEEPVNLDDKAESFSFDNEPNNQQEAFKRVSSEYLIDVMEEMQDLVDGDSIQLPWCPFLEEHYSRYDHLRRMNERYYVALNLFNSEKIVANLAVQLLFLSEFLGPHRLFVAIYENGSKDNTAEALAILRTFLEKSKVGHWIVTGEDVDEEAKKPIDWKHVNRIETLAKLRNKVLQPMLHVMVNQDNELFLPSPDSTQPSNVRFSRVIFMNDIFFCASDVLELLHQQIVQEAHITCGLDYVYLKSIRDHIFYDNWVTRDMSGVRAWSVTSVWRYQMLTRDLESRRRFEAGKPFQVLSCWNGAVVLDAEPFYKGITFRRSHVSMNECSASECSLLAKDFWSLGYGRVMIVPSVKMVYWSESYEAVHRDISPTAIALNVKQRDFLREGVHISGIEGRVVEENAWVQPVWRWNDEESRITWRRAPGKVVCLPLDGPGVHFADEKHPVWERAPNPLAAIHPLTTRHREDIS